MDTMSASVHLMEVGLTAKRELLFAEVYRYIIIIFAHHVKKRHHGSYTIARMRIC